MKSLFLNKHLRQGEPNLKKGFRVHWRETDVESLEILFDEARERVQDTVKDHYEITKRYFSLLVLVLSFSSALCVFLFSENANSWKLNAIAIVALLLCSLIILMIAQMIRPKRFSSPGREPYYAITKETFQNESIPKDQIKKFLLNQELLNCQAKIDLNQYYNKKRLDAIDYIIILMMSSFVVLGLLFIAVKFN